VKVGVSDYFYAEIQEGLKAGEVVSLELPKEERDKKARELASQKKSGGEAGPSARKWPLRAAERPPTGAAPLLPPVRPPIAPRKAVRLRRAPRAAAPALPTN